jgi:hypothetical protein
MPLAQPADQFAKSLSIMIDREAIQHLAGAINETDGVRAIGLIDAYQNSHRPISSIWYDPDRREPWRVAH